MFDVIFIKSLYCKFTVECSGEKNENRSMLDEVMKF